MIRHIERDDLARLRDDLARARLLEQGDDTHAVRLLDRFLRLVRSPRGN